MYIVTMLGQKGKREKGPAKIITDPKISVHEKLLTSLLQISVTCEHEVLELDKLVHDVAGKKASHHGADRADHDDEGDAAQTHADKVLQVQQSWSNDPLHNTQDWQQHQLIIN